MYPGRSCSELEEGDPTSLVFAFWREIDPHSSFTKRHACASLFTDRCRATALWKREKVAVRA